MPEPSPTPASVPEPSAGDRWVLLRDVLVFQVKLGVDALRDVVLSPVSLLAALLDLVGRDRGKPLFYRVLAEGRRTERWINLFGEADRIAPAEAEAGAGRPGMDRVVERMEALLKEQYERGGITAQAKATIDRSLDALARPRRPVGGPPGPEPPGDEGATREDR